MMIIRITVSGPQGCGKALFINAVKAMAALVGATVIAKEKHT